MHIVVTGGAGYVGFSLIRHLANRPDVAAITVLDNLSRRNYALFVSGNHGDVPVEFRQADILDGLSLDAAFAPADAVVHLAGHVSTPSDDATAHVYDQINNWGSAQVVRSVERSPSVRRVLYLSTFAVYGDQAEPFDEASVPLPTSAYGISKLAGEAHFNRLGDRSVAVLRAGNVFGFNPAIRFDAVVNAMCFQAWTQRKMRIDGDGEQTRPFIDVETLAAAIGDAIFAEAVTGTWNVATSNASVNDIADLVADRVPGVDRMYVNRETRMRNVALALPTRFAEFGAMTAPPLDVSIGQLIASLEGERVSPSLIHGN